jgi:hypothetical protein
VSTIPDDAKASHEQQVIATVARNLGISPEDLLVDPTFRKETGAEEMDGMEINLLHERSAE